MPYVPPHLRSAATTASTSSTRQDSRESDGPSSSARFTRSSSTRSFGGNDQSSDAPSAVKAVEPASLKWTPSDRVLAMTQEQVEEARDRLNVTVESEAVGFVDINPVETFEDMNLHPSVLQDIRSRQYTSPTAIQAQGVPIALSGRDILGCAETGSGKTASFVIPLVQHCLHRGAAKGRSRPGQGPLGVILAPTRELAQQIDREVKALCATSGFRSAIVVGGVSMSEQRSDLRSGVHILVATPGRLLDHLQQNNTSLVKTSFVVLDEADRMLDMGFEPQIREVLKNLPESHQMLLFSATMPEEIESMANEYLHEPVRVKVGKVSTPGANVHQALLKSTDANKLDDVTELLLSQKAEAEASNMDMPLTIVFVERKAKCDSVADALRAEGINAGPLHGGLSQGDREAALRRFSSGVTRVLVATDVASRGLDVKGIGHVINFDLPHTFEDYVHRIGRTGRAGAMGQSTSFFTDRDAFLVSQIKTALQDMERGNFSAFAVGKAARQREKELALQFKQKLQMGGTASGQEASGATGPVAVSDKLKFMAAVDMSAKGAADDAWDD